MVGYLNIVLEYILAMSSVLVSFIVTVVNGRNWNLVLRKTCDFETCWGSGLSLGEGEVAAPSPPILLVLDEVTIGLHI